MSEITFKNGSIIDGYDSSETIRGHRASMVEFYNCDLPIMDEKEVEEVLSKFINKEYLNKSVSEGSVVCLSSNWLKENVCE